MNTIRPFYSKRSERNLYEFHDKELNITKKAAGFDIDVYDPLRKHRIRKRIKADYSAVIIIAQNISAAVNSHDSAKVDEITGVKARTLNDLYKSFCANKRRMANRVGNGVSENTIKRYLVALKSMILPIHRGIEDVRTSQITVDWVEKRLRERINKGLSLKTLNTDLTHLKAIFKWGFENRFLEANPFTKIPKFKVTPQKPRILSMEEWSKLWDIAKYNRWRPIILTYLLTGARISEILKPKLSWEHVDFEKATITLASRKRGKSITIPMPDILRKELQALKENPYIKESSMRVDDDLYPFPFHKDYISHILKDEIYTPAGIVDISTHDLRRTFGSYLIFLGIPVAVVSQLMSHSSISTTEQVYLGQLDSVQRNALNGLANYLLTSDNKTVDMNNAP
ncbi:site-specific integrase [candidate division KSB1 bacterium]|nr:site-specific integrase [candidate division KSB1 bacterium]